MRGVLLMVCCCLFLVDVQAIWGQATRNGHQPLWQESFDGDATGAFPRQWQIRGDEDEARTIYRVVEEDGNRFLRAQADQQDIQIGITKEFAPEEFPLLQWRWRVSQLPTGGDERAKRTNDSAAALYVVFDSTLVPRAIKYVWSSTLPVGSKFQSPVYWRAHVVVLQSGPAEDGEWRQETINFYEDYKTLYGFEPGEVQGIALLTDSDITKSVATADYDDITILPVGALETLERNGAEAAASPAENASAPPALQTMPSP